MIAVNRNSDHLGLVVIWADRHPVGQYGYIAPLRTSTKQFILYFDSHCLADANEPIEEGVLVRFQCQEDEAGGLKAVNIRLEEFLDDNSSFEFSPRDLRCCQNLFVRLKVPSDIVAGYLRERLSLALCQLLDRWHGYGFSTQGPQLLVTDLNRLVRGALLFDRSIISALRLRRQTQLLLDKNPQGPELKRLNRLLIEDAYPTTLGRTPEYVDCSAPVVSGSVLTRGADHRSGWLKLHQRKAHFEAGGIPWGSWLPSPGTKVQCRIAGLTGMWQAYDIWEAPPRAGGAFPIQPRRRKLMANKKLWRSLLRSPSRPAQPSVMSRMSSGLESGEKKVPTTPSDSHSSNVAATSSVAPRRRGARRKRSVTSGFWYNLRTNTLVLPNGKRWPLRARDAEVVSTMVSKVPGSPTERVSRLNYRTVAELTVLGQLLDANRNLNKRFDKKRIDEMLKDERTTIKTDSKYARMIAQKWRRGFGAWLAGPDVDQRAAIGVSSRGESYHLGVGWDRKRLAQGDSEPSLVNPREQEKHA